jgi:hypothetical protein
MKIALGASRRKERDIQIHGGDALHIHWRVLGFEKNRIEEEWIADFDARHHKELTNLQTSLCAVRLLTLRGRILRAAALSPNTLAFAASHGVLMVRVDGVRSSGRFERVVVEEKMGGMRRVESSVVQKMWSGTAKHQRDQAANLIWIRRR